MSKPKLELTPELVAQAYRDTGLKPVVEDWGDGRTCGCLMTAVVKKYAPENLTYWGDPAHSFQLKGSFVYEAYEELTGSGVGVIGGFDNPEELYKGHSQEIADGVAFGKACRLYLKEVGMLS